jgi:hypothetical protein
MFQPNEFRRAFFCLITIANGYLSVNDSQDVGQTHQNSDMLILAYQNSFLERSYRNGWVEISLYGLETTY